MKKILLSVVTGSAALAAAVSPSAALGTATATAGTARVQKVDWGSCKDKDLRKAGVECGTVTVPLDHGRPNGTTITIAVSRHKATAPVAERLGVLVGNGLFFADLKDLGKKVIARYDLVGYDQRGSGESRPLLDCGGRYPLRPPAPAYQPTVGAGETPGANERAWVAIWDRFRTRCTAKYGTALRHYTAEAPARDVDLIRAALGAPRISYYSDFFSSGFIAQTYATLFPRRLSRMILHAPLAAGTAGYERAQGWAEPEGLHLQQFWAWIAAHDDVYGLGSTGSAVQNRYEARERKLARHPLPTFGAAEWSDSIALSALFEEDRWPDIAAGFAKWVRGDRKPLLEFYAKPADPSAVAELTTNIARECGDGTWPGDYETYRRDAFAGALVDPAMAWSNALFWVACRAWPVHGRLPALGSPTPDILMLVPAAQPRSLADTLTARGLFPGSSVLAVRNSLTKTDFAGNACVDNAVRAYLLTGAKPARKDGEGPDGTCAPAKKPEPLKADIKAAQKRASSGGATGGAGGAGGAGGGTGGTGGGTGGAGGP
jgi:pimeloyl-ACP methyl ester carboxylesterase